MPRNSNSPRIRRLNSKASWKSLTRRPNPVRKQLGQARAALANAILAGQSADQIAQITKTHTTAEAQMTGLEVKAFQKIYALLKPNQTARAPEAFDLMAGILDPATVGRGMGGGGRGRGGR